METRFIIAYSLIALMAALALFGALAYARSRARNRRRDAGQGNY